MKTPDYSKIPFPTIRQLLEDEGISSPSELVPVCYNGNRDEYLEHRLDFYIEEELEKVWKAYNVMHPATIWNTAMIHFAVLYDRVKDQYTYPGDPFTGLKKGQVYLINLKVLGGLIDLGVCHEVDMVDDEKKIIKLCYLKSGKTQGSQWIELIDNKDQTTTVKHTTYYKGTSFIRDHILYPHFHNKAIKQFHHNMAYLITNP